LRWGELRTAGGSPEANFLVAPSTDVRQQLKRLMTELNWSELERAAVTAVGEPCGRAWLDVHRYLWRASQELGYEALERAIVSSLQSILRDVPELPHWSFDDDTPTANVETLRWLEEVVIPKPPQPEAGAVEPFTVAARNGAVSNGAAAFAFAAEATADDGEQAETAAADVFALAQELIAQGNAAGAIHLLAEDAARQASGRARFRSRTQAARLCVAAGYESVAMPMLEQLAREIDERKLEGWESGELLAAPLLLLLRCMQEKDGSETASRELFARLCCIDPSAAIGVLK
jgi:type VI secretion system protein ImpA